MVIVRSREGGFVTQNCVNCEIPKAIRITALPDLYCGKCDNQLEKFKRQNYFYHCEDCEAEWDLAKLVPHWDELFEYYGYEIPDKSDKSYIETRVRVPLSASYSIH
jgi:hypothetical protein